MTRAIIFTKNEQNVVVQGGARVITVKDSALWSALLGQARTASDTAVSAATAALAAAGVGEYASTAAGLSGTSLGETFWVDLGNGTGQVYRHDAGPVATALHKFLIDPEGAGAADILGAVGGTIEERLTAADAALVMAAQVGTVFGDVGAKSIIQFPEWNYGPSSCGACFIGMGTADQPNIVGVPVIIEEVEGDGTTASFAVSPGFVVDDVSYLNIRVWKVTLATGAEELWEEDVDFTVTGKTTSTITITPDTVLPVGEGLRIRPYRKADAGNNPFLHVSLGYDNVSDGKGALTFLLGSHMTDIGNTAGHNVGFGSSAYISGSSYSIAGMLSPRIENALGATAFGLRPYATGTAPFVAGSTNKGGSYSGSWGEGNDARATYSTVRGRRGKARIAGDVVTASGTSGDASAGMVDLHNYILRRTVPSTSGITAIPPTGSSVFLMDDNSDAFVDATVSFTDPDTNNCREILVRGAVTRGVGAASTAMKIASSFTELQKTSGLVVTGGHWQAQIVHSAGSGGFIITFNGTSGAPDIIGVADVRVRYVARDAAAL